MSGIMMQQRAHYSRRGVRDRRADLRALIGCADDCAAIAYVWKQTQDVLMHDGARRQQRLAEEIGR